jgi:ribokinase
VTQAGTHRRLVVLGSVNMDLIVRTGHLPEPGETVQGRDFVTLPGGKGANQARAAARAGGRVSFVGAVGTDEFGPMLAATLATQGVSIDRLCRVPGPSGIAVITVDDNAENSIVVVPGANGQVRLAEADAALIREAAMLLLQLEIPLPTVLAGATAAAAAGVPVLLNPSPAYPLPPELLGRVTILVLNQGEAALLGEAALEKIPHVITTLGASGVRYRGPDGSTSDVPAPPVVAVDTTGAGDAFTGALAVAWVQGLDPLRAARRACSAGALATTYPGASAPPDSAAG